MRNGMEERELLHTDGLSVGYHGKELIKEIGISEKGRDRDIDRTKRGRKIHDFKDYRKAAAGDLRQRLCGKHQAV